MYEKEEHDILEDFGVRIVEDHFAGTVRKRYAPIDWDAESWIFTDEKVKALCKYIEEHFTVNPVHMVEDIIRYAAGQGMDEEKSIDLLLVLLDSTGITREEIDNILQEEEEEPQW